MSNRREILALGAAAGLDALSGVQRASAAPAVLATRALQTRLFNFKEDLSPAAISEQILNFKTAEKAPGVDSFMIGRNFIPTPFPTRFEWLYMIELGDGTAANDQVKALTAELSSHCRNEAACDLKSPFPAKFAAAAGVRIRHTVMFDFKPDAPLEARERNVEAIRRMGKLPMVQRYFVERSAGDRSDPNQMEWQVIGDFGSVDDYKSYSEAPVHLSIREDFTAQTSRVAFLDVEL